MKSHYKPMLNIQTNPDLNINDLLTWRKQMLWKYDPTDLPN
jgi:hypothetical protein